MKKVMKWGALIVLAIVLFAFAAFYVWSSATYGPSEELQQLVNVDDMNEIDDALVFEPAKDVQKSVGIVLYPGAKVERAAYSYYAQRLTEQGYTVIIPTMPFHFALFGANKAGDYMTQFSHIERWVVGGHSLGGVAAAMYAAEHDVDGLLFLAAYPSEGTNLREAAFPVLSLYAQYDGLTTKEDIEASKERLPAHTMFVEIKGGNHAQFGMYGAQKGDHAATISAVAQQDEMVAQTLQWLQP